MSEAKTGRGERTLYELRRRIAQVVAEVAQENHFEEMEITGGGTWSRFSVEEDGDTDEIEVSIRVNRNREQAAAQR